MGVCTAWVVSVCCAILVVVTVALLWGMSENISLFEFVFGCRVDHITTFCKVSSELMLAIVLMLDMYATLFCVPIYISYIIHNFCVSLRRSICAVGVAPSTVAGTQCHVCQPGFFELGHHQYTYTVSQKTDTPIMPPNIVLLLSL